MGLVAAGLVGSQTPEKLAARAGEKKSYQGHQPA